MRKGRLIRTFGTMTITARHAHDICRHARQLEICVLQYFVDAVHAPRVLCRQLSSLPSQVSQLTLLALRDMA